MTKTNDVVIIGGGPAGMIAAIAAAEAGAKVTILEKNPALGKKLLLTGGTRCNLTNLNLTKERLVELFGPNGKFLFSGLSAFGVSETIRFFDNHGLQTKEEENGCIFTQNNNAQDVLQTLHNILVKDNASILTNSTVINLTKENNKITTLTLTNQEIKADKVIICTGGLSLPQTGSSGDGYTWASRLGHTIVPLRPALTPVIVEDTWIKDLQGISLPKIPAVLYLNNKKTSVACGDLLFTEHGLSGPLIHNLSRQIGELIRSGSVTLGLDLYPALSLEALDKKLQAELPNNKMIKNYLEGLVAKRIAELMLQLGSLNPTKACNTITKEERKVILKFLKDFRFTIAGLAGYDKAMITAGGISLKEIDGKTMRSKIIENLYFAGEILDLDGPSGGYNLQVCWTTGYVAGKNAGN